MKKTIRLIIAAVAVMLICVSFCSCSRLDEMRQDHAVYGKTQNEVIFRGNTYRLLPADENIHRLAGKTAFLTTDDVPVLLSTRVSNTVSYSNDEVFIYDDRIFNKELGEYVLGVYCREDMYDKYCEMLKNYKMDCYCIYDEWSVSDDISFEFHSGNRLLNADEVRLINGILAAEPEVRDLNIADNQQYRYVGHEVSRCDSTLMFIDTKECITLRESKDKSFLEYKGDLYGIPDDDVNAVFKLFAPIDY